MNTAIILARGGSKGIQNKNLQKIGNESLLERALNTTLKANIFSQIIVSSDSTEILKKVQSNKIDIHKRSFKTSSDHSTSEEALEEVMLDLGLDEGTIFMIQCTTPFLNYEDLQNINTIFPHGNSHTIMSGFFENVHHWYYENSKITPIGKSANKRVSRQTRRHKIFVENGAVYAFDVKNFLIKKNRFLDTVQFYEMPKERSIDIDTHFDLDIARFIGC